MKTHGEKRVRAILEVFHAVHALVAGMGTQEHLVVRIVPRRIDQVEQWTGRALQRPGIPGEQEIFASFVEPAAGTDPHRRHATDRHAGREPAGRGRPHHQRAAGRAKHGADPCPRLSIAQRDQRHHDGPLADGAAPGPRASREVPGRSGRVGPACPICGSSTRPSSCSIPAAAAAQPVRWSRPASWPSKKTSCWKCHPCDPGYAFLLLLQPVQHLGTCQECERCRVPTAFRCCWPSC